MAIEVRFASDWSYDYDDDDDYDDAPHGYGDNTLEDGVDAEGSEPDYEDDFFGDDDFWTRPGVSHALSPAGFEPRIPHVSNSGPECRVCLSPT